MNIKSKIFKKALQEYDDYKDKLDWDVMNGDITIEERDTLLSAKASELDL